jgi:hypothetical protein
MNAHSIVYIILSVLSLVAVYAVGAPVNQAPQEQHEPGNTDEDSTDSL